MLNARRPNPLPVRPSRRGLLAGAGALVVAFRLDPKSARAAAGPNLADVKAQPNAFVRIGADEVELALAEPVAAITPGQSLVAYDGTRVLGGGVIEAAVGHRAALPVLAA